MKASTLIWVGGLGLLGWLAYRSLSKSVSATAARLQAPTVSNTHIPPGLQAQIDAGSYNGQALRMGINTPKTGLSGWR